MAITEQQRQEWRAMSKANQSVIQTEKELRIVPIDDVQRVVFDQLGEVNQVEQPTERPDLVAGVRPTAEKITDARIVHVERYNAGNTLQAFVEITWQRLY